MLQTLKRSALMNARDVGARILQHRMRGLDELNHEQFNSMQAELLRETYLDAIKYVPHYKTGVKYPKRISEKNFLEEFAQLPILEKPTVKQNTEQFLREPRSKFLLRHTTGGTTGSPLEIFQSPIARLNTQAVLNAAYAKFCNLRKPRILNLTGFLSGDQLLHRRPFTKSAFLSIYQLKPQMRDRISHFLQDYQPQLIYGYASALVQLAHLYPEGLPYPLVDNRLRCVSTSETLLESDRELIEKNLDATVHNQYGSQEGQHFVFECDHRGMHIHPTRGFLEILDFNTNRPASPGEPGRVVVTGFQNRNMPLLRYSIGDTATPSAVGNECTCGCFWPTIQDVQGRTEDLVRTPDGRRIGLISHSTLKDLSGIKESQIVQHQYDSFTYLMVVSGLYDPEYAENHVQRELGDRLGYPPKVTFEYVKSIPKSSSGKHQAVVVKID